MSEKWRKARYIQTLVYADGPHVILLMAGKKDNIIVAVAVYKDGVNHPFFGVSVHPEDWKRYLRGNVDLRFLFTYPNVKTFYEFDFSTIRDNEIRMNIWGDEPPEEFLPEPRFFSYHHTERYGEIASADSHASFDIDGQWDVPDFSHFYGKYSDVYAFNLGIRIFKDEREDQERKRKIFDAFIHPWRGGFSYVSFYDELLSAQNDNERLAIKRLQYASPGDVILAGRSDVFVDVERSIRHFEVNRRTITEHYKTLYNFLSKNKLLKGTEDDDGGTAFGRFINSRTSELAGSMLLDDFSLLLSLSNNKPLITAKVVLSYYRRLDRAFSFFAEGRVRFSIRESD